VLRSSFGPIRVALPANSNYDLTADTSFGDIRTEFPLSVSGRLNSKSVSGKIGSGGCRLDLGNQNGGIEVLKGSR
jgi:hypothetical protein